VIEKRLAALVVATTLMLGCWVATEASATVLCHTNTSPCTSIVGAGNEVKSVLASPWVLKAGFANVECSEGSMNPSVENAGGPTSTVVGKVIQFLAGVCNCSVTTLRNGGVEWHWISGSFNATLTSNALEITVSCFGAHCVYGTGGATHIGVFTGGTGRIDVNASLKRLEGSFLCASPASWSASYNVTSPSPLYAESS
jgi:hypothetical protein